MLNCLWARVSVILTIGTFTFVSCARYPRNVVNGCPDPGLNPHTVNISLLGDAWSVEDKTYVCPGDIITWQQADKDSNVYAIRFKHTDPIAPTKPFHFTKQQYSIQSGTPEGDDPYTIACISCNPGVPDLDPHVIIMGPK